MLLTEYETTVIMRPDVSGDTIEDILARLRGVIGEVGGKLLHIENWGKNKKRLAYEIAKQTHGIYVHLNFLGQGDLVAEMERHLRISDKVIRFLTVKLAERVHPDQREAKEYVQPAYDSDTNEEAAGDAGVGLDEGEALQASRAEEAEDAGHEDSRNDGALDDDALDDDALDDKE